MEDVRDTKKVLESYGDVHNKVEIQSNSELQISSPTRSPGPPCIQIDSQNAYDLRFGRSTYARKAKEITFPMVLVPCPTKIGVSRNHQNNLDFQNCPGAAPPILAHWAVYQVRVRQGCVLGFDHDSQPLYSVAAVIFTGVLLRLIC